MKELLQLLAGPLVFLLEHGRFSIVDSSSGRSFGDASVTLQSAGVRLELVRDRSQISIRFQPALGPADEWFWIGVLRRLLEGDRPGSDELDRGAIEFLRRSLDNLEDRAASADGSAKLVDDLTRARENRAQELFG
ncbi:MAG: hypothetical protein KDA95_03445 [Acidimicrobiales bacterium]|nr:hypothetical protein [Acidimicrobiales bacterium]